METARELLASRSYSEVGVQELCECAGVRKGSFYHFFPSKRDLAVEALERQRELFRVHLLEPAFRPDVPPLQRLERLFRLAYEGARAEKEGSGFLRGCPFGSLAAEVSTQDDVLRAKVEAILEGTVAYVRKTLEEAGIETAEADGTARSLVAFMQGAMLLAKCSNNPEVLRDLGPRAMRLVPGTSTWSSSFQRTNLEVRDGR